MRCRSFNPVRPGAALPRMGGVLLAAWLLVAPGRAAAQIRFTDVTAAAGLNAIGEGNGGAFGDLDANGWPDLVVARNSAREEALLYGNRGDGTFVADAFQWVPPRGVVGALFVDVDGDADEDLYLVVHAGPNELHLNEGGRLVRAPLPADDFLESGNAMGAFFADLDADGVVELFTTHRFWFANQWLHGLGTPAVTDLAELASPLRSGNEVFGATPFDFDDDGDLDVYVCSVGYANLLHRNDGGGAFHTLPGAAGMASAAASSAALPGDADGDGRLDLYVINSSGQANHLFRRDAGVELHYTDDAGPAGVAGADNSAAGAWVDLDNDGDEDLVVANVNGPLQVFRNDGTGVFADVSAAATDVHPEGGTTGLAVADIDRDGDVDVFLTTPGDSDFLLRNDSRGGDWLQLELGAAAHLSGARVELRSEGKVQVRQFALATSIGTVHGDLLHFGLGAGAGDSVDVVVDWPTGQRQRLRVPRNRSVPLRPQPVGRDLAVARVMEPGLAPGWDGFAARVAVVNRGRVRAGAALSVHIDGPGRSWERRQEVTPVAPGDTALVAFERWRPDRPGKWHVEIRLEGGDDGVANDTWRRDYHFHEFHDRAPDLGVDDAGPGWAGAFADYDNDGDLDLYVSNGGARGAGDNVLYRNDGRAGFSEVTAAAGVEDSDNGTGVVFADFDRDGDEDLFIAKGGFTRSGQANRLFRNGGDGTFEDISVESGLDDPRSSYAAIIGDYDRDGFLDLVVSQLRGQEVTFYRNVAGSFNDVTRSKQIQSFFRYSTSAGSFSDYDNDGDIDLYVGTFGTFDSFYANVGDTAYAVSPVGDRGEMVGVTVGDFDGDADLDIYTVNMNGRSAIYENLIESTTFLDVGSETGTENKAFGTGCTFIDYDGDGDLDLYVVNLFFPDRLYVNLGDGTFVDGAAGFGLDQRDNARAVLVGDVDNDGDPDAYVVNENSANRMYINGGVQGWLTVHVRGTTSNTDAIGARLTAFVDGSALLREVNGTSGMSYSSRVTHFGLGEATVVDSLVVNWPSGRVETHGRLAANTTVRLVEGRALTAVEAGAAATPQAMRLDEVFPNPFNATAVVAFVLPRTGRVRLQVYNAVGQRLRTLVAGAQLTAGRHRLTWDGRDDAGRAAASGVYYAHLEAFGQRRVRPMVLVR